MNSTAPNSATLIIPSGIACAPNPASSAPPTAAPSAWPIEADEPESARANGAFGPATPTSRTLFIGPTENSAVEAAMKDGHLLAESIAEGRSDSFAVQADGLKPKADKDIR